MSRVIRNRTYRLVALAVSVVILVIVYFVAINPSNDTPTPGRTPGAQQLHPAAKPAAKPSRGSLPVGVRHLTACILAAGADIPRIHACQARYRP